MNNKIDFRFPKPKSTFVQRSVATSGEQEKAFLHVILIL